MGSSFGTALTRMVLIYLDVLHYTSQPRAVRPRLHTRISSIYVAGVLIVILEIRYVDDCIILWKGPSHIPAAVRKKIDKFLRSRMESRYPIELDDDMGDNFVGLHLSTDMLGKFVSRPSMRSPPSLYDSFGIPGFMIFRSYTSDTIKRSLILGLIARIDTYTVPDPFKPYVLHDLLQQLRDEAHFPPCLCENGLLRQGFGRDHGCEMDFWYEDVATVL